jgi:hypothetical protein
MRRWKETAGFSAWIFGNSGTSAVNRASSSSSGTDSPGYDILRLNEAAIVRLWLVEKAKNPKQEDDWNWDSDQPEQ